MCMRLLGILAGSKAAKQNCCCPPAIPAWSTPFPPVGIQCHSSKTWRPTLAQLACKFQSLLNIDWLCLSTDAASWMGRSISKTSSDQSQNASLPRHRKFGSAMEEVMTFCSKPGFQLACLMPSSDFRGTCYSYHHAQHAKRLSQT